MEFKATQKYVLTSPKKLREVSVLLKNLSPTDAIDRLPFVGKRAAEPLRKVIMTAIANAKQKGVSDSQLVFKEVQITEGPRLKRFMAGARGRAKPYKKKMSHIRIVLATQELKSPSTEKKESQKVKSEKYEKKDETENVKSVKSVKVKKLDK